MKKAIFVLLAIASLSLSATAHAANPLATDDTGTQGKMKFQMETNAEFGWDRDTSNGTTIKTDNQLLNAVITAGVIDPLDMVLTLPFTWQQISENRIKTYDQGGLNDVSLALKWRFVELGSASLAIKPAFTFPSGDYNRRVGNGRPAYGAILISTAEFKPVTVSANVGYTFQKYTDADKTVHRESLWNLSLAGSAEVMRGLQLVAEIGTATNANRPGTNWPTFVTGGAIYSIIESLDLSLGVKFGLNEPETDITLLPGISFKFP